MSPARSAGGWRGGFAIGPGGASIAARAHVCRSAEDQTRAVPPCTAEFHVNPHEVAVNVVFVCMGNICRSPMAESVLRHELEQAGLDHVSVHSAGTGSWHVGDPMDRRAKAALERRGYGTEHTARQFESSWFDQYHLVVALDRDNQRDLRKLAPTRRHDDNVRLLLEFDPDAETLDVPDPYYGAAADFDEVLRQIEQACQGLVIQLQDDTLASREVG
jgi:protein-tyrosine phosphatase